MAASDDGPNFTDFIVTSISPVLIVGLVGSLVFFLVEILYGGKYEGRLLWTLFFFVIGIVLVARVAIQVDAGRAMAYGLALAVVCWLALMAFIEYPRDSSMAPFAPIINLVLMGVVWWCANKLTWDCTFIDENRISASKGLLVASGMEPRSDSSDKTLPEPKRGKARGGFWERYQRYRDRRAKQPHTPGVTVVYFSLAALPIFGLGQSLIPSDDASRRSFAFTLAACYVGCGLGLLLTTSFLGLRRYLRQHRRENARRHDGNLAWHGECIDRRILAGCSSVAASLFRNSHLESGSHWFTRSEGVQKCAVARWNTR